MNETINVTMNELRRDLVIQIKEDLQLDKEETTTNKSDWNRTFVDKMAKSYHMMLQTRAEKLNFLKSISKADAQGALNRLYPKYVLDG